jgi:hypothetical protein
MLRILPRLGWPPAVMKFFFLGDVADLQYQTVSATPSPKLLNRTISREKERDTYGTNSSFPHTDDLRRSLLAQESFSSVVIVQSCLCSRSSSMAEKDPEKEPELEPIVGTRPEYHRLSVILFLSPI